MQSWLDLPETQALQSLSRDGRLLFATRIVRMFGYGLISVVLALYLVEVGATIEQIGMLFTATLLGSAAISLWISTSADRLGRRRMLMAGAALMVVAGTAFASTHNLLVLTIAAIFGTISPNGNEVGPCQPIEHAALPQSTADQHRTQVFAWYNLAGYLATAAGALVSGVVAQTLQSMAVSAQDSYRVLIVAYALVGVALALLFTRLSPAVEATPRRAARASGRRAVPAPRMGLHRSRGLVLRLSALSMLDSFGGGLVMQSLMAYWFTVRFGVEPGLLGGIFFGANVFAGWSSLAAARIANRIGLLNTMVFTHLPSNILLMLVPLMPSLPLAIMVLLARFSLSQMDMPTRQSYLVAVVDPDERSAASGITITARTLASAFAPTVTGIMLTASLLSLPFLASGGVKIVYDLSMLYSFRSIVPPEEARAAPAK